MAVPPANLGDHDAKLPVIEAEVEPVAHAEGALQIREGDGQQPAASEMHEVEALFEANRHAPCRVEQVLITVRSAKRSLHGHDCATCSCTIHPPFAVPPRRAPRPHAQTHPAPLQGIERTKGYVVARELEEVRAARTLEEVLEALQGVHSALDSLGIFEAVEIVIDRSGAVPHLHVTSLVASSHGRACPAHLMSSRAVFSFARSRENATSS